VAQPRCFTLRLPPELYVELYELATAQGKTLNATVIELVRIAMSHKVDVREALKELLDREFGSGDISSKS
jgi:predicted DNA-binding protein